MEKLLETLNELNTTYDMSDFYCITIWPDSKQINLQGYFTDNNLGMARELDVHLTLQDNIIRGENEYYKIALTT
jgi:hypothetical protein